MQQLLPVFPVEDQIVSAIQANSNVLLDLFFKTITYLGHPAVWLAIASLLYWTNKERQSFFLVNTIVFAAAATSVLKVFFARPRPSELLHRVFPSDKISTILEGNMPQFGFPSGHATTIAAALTYFSKNKNSLITWIFLILTVLVAFSRICLGKHFPLDVIAGLAAGACIGFFVLWIEKTFEKHNFHLSKMEDEIIVIALIGIGIIAIALLDIPVLAVSFLGYYAGFFFAKEVGFEQKVYSGRKKILKILIGIISVVIMLLMTTALFEVNKPLALACFFGNGYWITYGFPELYDRSIKIVCKFPAVEKALK